MRPPRESLRTTTGCVSTVALFDGPLAANGLKPDDGFGTKEVALPAGEATHLTQQTRPSDREVFSSAFVVARDGGYVWLWCTSLDATAPTKWIYDFHRRCALRTRRRSDRASLRSLYMAVLRERGFYDPWKRARKASSANNSW